MNNLTKPDDSCPQVSVPILTYNSSWERIRATLNSVILQKGIDFEVIVSDDCSDNNHSEEIKNFFARHQFTNYQLILHEKNLGTVKNLLDAVNHSKSDYIKGIGQGDMLFDEYTLRDVYEDFIKSGASMGGTAYVLFNKFEVPLKLCKSYHLPQDINVYRYGTTEQKKKSMLVDRNFMHGPTMIYRREILIKYLNILADAGIRYTEDIIPWLMAANEEKLSCFNRISVFYESGVGFASHSTDLMKRDHDVMINLIAEKLKDKDSALAQKMKGRHAASENKYKIRKALGRFAGPVAQIYKLAKRIISGKKVYYTETNVPTDFANLCMTRE